MAQTVSLRLLTAEIRVQSQTTECGICDGQSDIRTGFSPCTSIFPYKYHSSVTDAVKSRQLVSSLNNAIKKGSVTMGHKL
jgi:hypothetical protein